VLLLAFAESAIGGLLWGRQKGRTDLCTEAVILVGAEIAAKIRPPGGVAVVVIAKLVKGSTGLLLQAAGPPAAQRASGGSPVSECTAR
jgi:hypothetical protein